MSFFNRPSDPLNENDLEKIKVLNRIKLFENCAREDLKEVVRGCEFQFPEPEDVIIKKGETGGGMYLIDNGTFEVKLSKNDDPIAKFESGEFFGEMSILDTTERSANVVCSEKGRLLYLPKEKFNKLLRTAPKTTGKILYVFARTLSRRLRKTNQELREERIS